MIQRSAASAFRTRIVTDTEALEDFSRPWNSLPQAQCSPLLNMDWFVPAVRELHGPETLRAMLVESDESLVGAGALVAAGKGPGSHLEIAGSSALFEPTGVLYEDENALSELLRAIVASSRPIVLQRVDSTGIIARCLRKVTKGRGIVLERHAASTPYLDLPSSWEDLTASVSRRRLQDYRRARRALERAGEVKVDIRRSTAESVAAEFEEAARVESAGWKSRRGSAMKRNDALRRFFAGTAGRFASRNALRLCFLRVDGEAIAMQIALEYDNRWWVLKVGYDERWGKQSPGIQLMWDLLRFACESGMRSFEFLGTAEPWLSIWTSTERRQSTLVYYPYNLRGACKFVTDSVARLRRRFYRRHF